MAFPVDFSLLHNVGHMPALPVLERSMGRGGGKLQDFCIPVNSYFPTPEMIGELQSRLVEILRYYPGDNQTVADLLGRIFQLDSAHVVAANGSTELITWINERLITRDLVTDVPTFGRWTDNAREQGRVVHPYFRRAANDFRIDVDDLIRFTRDSGAKALAICNPSNPTGAFLQRREVLHLLEETSHLDVVVIDESFIDFACEDFVPTIAHDVAKHSNAIVIKSLGKNLGLHGLRCGYAVACQELASNLRRMLPPWNVNSLAEEFIRMLATNRDEYASARRRSVRDARAFERRLSQVDGLTAFPTNANFVYCCLDARIPGIQLRDLLLERFGCFVRECGSKIGSSSQYLRIAARPQPQQDLLVGALDQAICSIRRSNRCGTDFVDLPSRGSLLTAATRNS